MGKSQLPPFIIRLKEGAQARLWKKRAVMRPFPCRGPKRELLKKTLADLVECGAGIMNASPGPFFVSPCFFAKRRHSDKLRLCIDYKILNEEVIDEAFVLPCIDKVIRRFKGKHWFAIID